MTKCKMNKIVYIRPEDVTEAILRLMNRCKTIDELREHVNKMNYNLKNEKFERLSEYFDIVL